MQNTNLQNKERIWSASVHITFSDIIFRGHKTEWQVTVTKVRVGFRSPPLDFSIISYYDHNGKIPDIDNIYPQVILSMAVNNINKN